MRPWGALGDHLGQKMTKGTPKGANGTKMEPKWSQNGAKMEPSIVQKALKNRACFLPRFWNDFGCQKCPKLEPFSVEKRGRAKF